tara:strand:- start:44 stop:1219 length:1176 start_codon:yes stop_codon:yes gene_type:complete
MQKSGDTLFSTQFVLLALSSVLFMGSFNMIIPELPSYLTSLGGKEYKGLIISLFTLTAGLSRPFSGKLADTIGRMPVMVIGVIVCIVIGVLYPLLNSITGFFILRLIHGFSTGFKPTGTSAFLADIVPINKRGEALGYIGVAGSIGMAGGPVLGSYIAQEFGIDNMFYSSSIVALLSIIILGGMKETLPNKEKFKLKHLIISPKDVIDLSVIAPSLVMTLTAFSFGIILTVVPDFSDHLEISNRGTFFSFMLIASIFVRFFAGKASDKYGRVGLIKIGSILLSAGMMIVAFATSTIMFLSGAVVIGISVGINSPTIFAWTVDLVDDKHRGRGLSTMFIALEIAIGVGAFSSGFTYNNDPSNFPLTFGLGSILAFSSFVYLMIYTKQHTCLG